MSHRLARLLSAAAVVPPSAATDADLLARCAAGRDPVAFELVVRRHAGLVWRVCRSAARDHHAAEDAFQATFLALARRPGAVRDGSAAGWLYRVAHHAALRTRRAAGFIPAVGSAADPPSADPGPAAAADRSEQGRLLYAELSRLPADLRAAVVLCHLEGLTQAEAAERLGWPLGTVATRVRRGLDRLRGRLVRRGVGLSLAGLAAADAGAVPPRLVGMAAGFGAGAVPGPGVAQLTTGVLLAMSYTKLKMLAVGLVVAAAAAGGVTTWAVGQTPGAKPAEPAKAPPVAVAVKGPPAADYFDRTDGLKRLKRVGLAAHDFLDANGHFPTDITNKAGTPLLSWRVALLPYLDEGFLADQFKTDEPWDGDHNRKFLAYVPRAYRTPRAAAGQTRVQGFAGPGAAFEPGKAFRIVDYTDGTVDTILAVEAGSAVPWTKPADLPFDPKGPLPNLDGPFAEGFAVLTADASGRWVRRDVGETFLRAAITRAGGELFASPVGETAVRAWDGGVGGRRPETDREKEELTKVRGWFTKERELQRGQVEERFRLTEALRKAAPDALVLDPPAGDDLGAWTLAERRLNQVQQADLGEIFRLWAELEKRDPKAAERLRKELALPPAKK